MKRIAVGIAGALLCLGAVTAPQASARTTAHGRSRIVDGQRAARRQYPWQVALLTADNRRLHCGGVLVGPRRVLTAEHCVQDQTARDFLVMAGKRRLSDARAADRYPIAQIVNPPDPPPYLDVAILKLARPVRGIRPIRVIGRQGTRDDALWRPGTRLRLTGWGALRANGPYPDQLRATDVVRRPDAVCHRAYRGAFSAATELCAGGLVDPVTKKVPDACTGDSGGPLVAPAVARADPRRSRDWRVVGLVSYGWCGRRGSPTVYTRLAGPRIHAFVTRR